MAIHHIVPRMVLRRFAANGRRLVAVPRGGGQGVPMSVNKACAETEFYRMEVELEYQGEFPPDKVEASLSYFEGKAEAVITRLVTGEFALTDWDRFWLTLFVSLQAARGWSFRSDIADLATIYGRWEWLGRFSGEDHLRSSLQRRGEPHDDEAIQKCRDEILTGNWKIVPSGSAAVQQMLFAALEVNHPHLFLARRIRVLRFRDPVLLTSDQPVALWARPHRDLNAEPLGLATADAIWMPLDRRHALALLQTGDEGIFDSTPKRAEQINLAVAASGYRWIFQHPDDEPLDTSTLPPPQRWTVETMSVTQDEDVLRVRNRIVRRAG